MIFILINREIGHRAGALEVFGTQARKGRYCYATNQQITALAEIYQDADVCSFFLLSFFSSFYFCLSCLLICFVELEVKDTRRGVQRHHSVLRVAEGHKWM